MDMEILDIISLISTFTMLVMIVYMVITIKLEPLKRLKSLKNIWILCLVISGLEFVTLDPLIGIVWAFNSIIWMGAYKNIEKTCKKFK